MKRFTALILALALLVCALPAASAVSTDEIVFYEVTEDEVGNITANSDGTRATYSTLTMQGNTENPADCEAFIDALRASGNGYTIFDERGWSESTGNPYQVRVNESEFKGMKNYTVAYYSGHGGFTNGYPIVNYIPSNSAYNYGTSTPINVATALGVSTSSWQSTAYIKPSDPIRVLVLAACSQLDSNCVKYYGRIMKASGIRAIAGYHDTAPSAGDDTIATNFVELADDGNSIMYSWQNANPVSNWAVLVYRSNDNMYYRFPGFPGRRYNDPSDMKVYRYASFLSSYQEVVTGVGTNNEEEILSLPLTISTTDISTRAATQNTKRELEESLASVADNNDVVENYLLDYFSEDLTSGKICVESYVSREEVDENVGLLSETETVVERTYNYFDTYNGIKIADSYVGASVDAAGAKNVSDVRKTVVSAGNSAMEMSAQKVTAQKLLTEAEAIEIVRNEDSCCGDLNVQSVSLAYAPVSGGNHVLCYEVLSNHGFTYVSIENGSIINLL